MLISMTLQEAMRQAAARLRTYGSTLLGVCAVAMVVLTRSSSELGAPWLESPTALDGRRAKLASDVMDLLGPEIDVQRREAVWFLAAFMPDADLEGLAASYVADNVRLAFEARETFPWAQAAPWPLFLNDVLPYASLTEPRDDWREQFMRFMTAHVEHCSSARCAALALNDKAWTIVNPPIKYEAAKVNGLNSYGPFQTMRRHNSSCTGLAVFLVDALRSVGVPARVAGTPHWNRGPQLCPRGDADEQCGNHNWVEAYLDDEWHFLDQAGDKRLDHGWFFPGRTDLQRADGVNHTIFASSWAPARTMASWAGSLLYPFEPADHFPLAWDWDTTTVPAWDAVSWYHWKSGKTKAAAASDLHFNMDFALEDEA